MTVQVHILSLGKGLGRGPSVANFFNIAVDVLNFLIQLAVDNGLIEGLIDGMVEGGLSMLQYADDTIFLFKDNVDTLQEI